MAFPTSPSDGDLHTEFGRTFKYASATNSWSVATPDAPVDNTPTTQGYVDTASLPLADVVPGSKAFVEDGNKLFIFTGSGWFEIATVNTAPTITTGANATYSLEPNGSPVVITLQATDPEGTPIIWGYQVTSGSLGDAIVTNIDNVFTITPGSTPTTFDLSFTASDGVNIDTSASSFTIAVLAGQVEFTSPGTYSWTAPAGVTSVSVVAVGGGGGAVRNNAYCRGGAGGGLGWKNNIQVTPGQSYTVVVGAGGGYTTTGSVAAGTGGNSYFISTSTVCGFGGTGGKYNGPAGVGGGFTGDGGGNGGHGGVGQSNQYGPGGGGGAGGYSGNGGNGGYYTTSDWAGGDGSGGGGGGGAGSSVAGGGGGVGIYGQGTSGLGGTTNGNGGRGGSGGGDAQWGPPSNSRNSSGALYGGGGGAQSYSTYSGMTVGSGAGGAVRIIWGSGRAFPSTNTANV